MAEQPNQPTNPTPATRPAPGNKVIDRAKNILITPKNEWPVVDKETTKPASILTSYILPMLSIGAIATFIGQGLIGRNLGYFGGTTASAKAGLIGAVLFVALTVVTVYIVAAAIDVLAQSFGSEKNWNKSFQLAAYSLTPAYVGAIFLIFPALGIVYILCTLYSIYPLYTGIPVMKKTPVDKHVAYLAVVILITVIAVILVGVIQSEIIKSFSRPRLGGYGF